MLQCKLIICNVILLLNCKGGLLLFLLLFVTPIVGFCNCSMFCCALLCVHSSFAIISVALLCLSCWCLIVVWLFLTMPSVCLQFVIVVFPVHTHFLFLAKQQTGYQYLIAWSLCIKYIIYSRLSIGVLFNFCVMTSF